MAILTGRLEAWRTELAWLSEVLAQGGIVVTTCDAGGAVLLRTVMQLDGDVVQIVTSDLLRADAPLRDATAAAHFAQVRDRLAAPLTRLLAGLRAWRGRIAAGAIAVPLGTTAWQAWALLLHGAPGAAAILGAALRCAPVLVTPFILPSLRSASRACLRRIARHALN